MKYSVAFAVAIVVLPIMTARATPPRGAATSAIAELHAIRPDANGHSAWNLAQRWTTTFDGRGAITRPDHGGFEWGLELRAFGVVDELRDVATPRSIAVSGSRIEYVHDAALREWYVNDTRGLEHGFTVLEPLGTDLAAPLEFVLAVRGGLSAVVAADGRDVAFFDRSGGSVVDYVGLRVFDATARDLDASFAVAEGMLHLRVDARGATYPITIDPIALQAYLKASNTEAGDQFGYSVAVSGDTLVIGAPFESSIATGVGGNGADNSANDSGAAYVFVKSGSAWTQQAYLKASNTDALDRFGSAVAISGDTIVVTAPREASAATTINGNEADDTSPFTGAAYVFVRSGSTWSQQAYLKASDASSFAEFGNAVAIDGDTIAVGCQNQSTTVYQSGAVYVFVRSGSAWSEQQRLKAAVLGNQDHLGGAVAIDGDTVVAGAIEEDSNATTVNGDANNNAATASGAAVVFVRSGSSWSQQGYLKAANANAGDHFGYSVGVSGDSIVVGAPDEDGNATTVNGDASNNSAIAAGAAYVFARSGAVWSQQAYLKPANTDAGDQFGRAAGIDGDLVVIGAQLEASAATGVNGNGASDAAPNSGAAYTFARSGGSWTQDAYLKASNTDINDGFGYAVAVAADRVVAGALFESSKATGVNGSQADNTESQAGAAYVFDSSPVTVSLAWVAEFTTATPTICKRFATPENKKLYAITPACDVKEYEVTVTDGGAIPASPVTLKVTVSGDVTATGHEPHGISGAPGEWYHGWLFDTKKPKKVAELKSKLKGKVAQHKAPGGAHGAAELVIANGCVGKGEITITSDADGKARFRYVPAEVAGTDTITVEVVPGAGQIPPPPLTTTIEVAVPELTEFPESPDGYWEFVNNTPGIHSETRYGTDELQASLCDAAIEYRALMEDDAELDSLRAQLIAAGYAFTYPKLYINDMSLPRGGLMDIDGDGAAPHGGHRLGLNADIRSIHLVPDAKKPTVGAPDPAVTDEAVQALVKKARVREFALMVLALEAMDLSVKKDEGNHLHVTVK